MLTDSSYSLCMATVLKVEPKITRLLNSIYFYHFPFCMEIFQILPIVSVAEGGQTSPTDPGITPLPHLHNEMHQRGERTGAH